MVSISPVGQENGMLLLVHFAILIYCVRFLTYNVVTRFSQSLISILMKTEHQITFGKRLRALRHERELSQEKLGALAGLHPNYICSIEKGDRNVSLNNIWKLAKALQVHPSKLFEHSEL